MVVKFKVGKIYWCNVTRYASDRETLKQVKIRFLCVKRNDATGYVSFQQMYKGRGLGKIESRKVSINVPFGFTAKEKFEEVSIGYGGSGAWRNWYILTADKVE